LPSASESRASFSALASYLPTAKRSPVPVLKVYKSPPPPGMRWNSAPAPPPFGTAPLASVAKALSASFQPVSSVASVVLKSDHGPLPSQAQSMFQRAPTADFQTRPGKLQGTPSNETGLLEAVHFVRCTSAPPCAGSATATLG